MENIEKLKEEFNRIVQKYELNKEDKAKKISKYLTKSSKDSITPQEFAKEIGTSEEEAKTFLKFIEKGIQFKEKHVDNKSDNKK